LVAWDVTGKRRAAELDLGAPVRSLALDAAAARGDAGALAVGTADGALHIVGFSVRDAAPVLGPVARRALSDGAIGAVAWDPAARWVAGGAAGQLWVIDERSESKKRDPAGSAGGEGARPLSIDERSESGGRGPTGSTGGKGARPLSIDERSES